MLIFSRFVCNALLLHLYVQLLELNEQAKRNSAAEERQVRERIGEVEL